MWHSLYNKTDWEASEESVQNSQKDGQQGTAILQVHVNTFNPCAEDGNGTACLHVYECDYNRKRFIFRYDKQDVSFAKRSLKTKKVYGYDCPVGSIMAELACGMFHYIVIYCFIFHIAKGD